MILFRYITKRLLLTSFSINIGLTLLFNLIEFFEKMVRANQATSYTILYFILLNMIPSFFDNLAISTWLGSCMVIKEMYQQNEWETLQLLNVKISSIFLLVAITGIGLATCSFVGKEIITEKIAHRAQTFKLQQFKNNRHQKLFNQWFTLNEKLFCHFNFLDTRKSKGTQLSLIEVSPTFNITRITTAQKFLLDQEQKKIIVPQGIVTIPENKNRHSPHQEAVTNTQFTLPSFFTQLHIQGIAPPLKQLFHAILFDNNSLPKHVYHQLLYLFLTQVLAHLLILLLPLLTFTLFFLFPYHSYYRWIAIFLPYPLFSLLNTLTDSCMAAFSHGLISLIPYAILSIATIGIYSTIRK